MKSKYEEYRKIVLRLISPWIHLQHYSYHVEIKLYKKSLKMYICDIRPELGQSLLKSHLLLIKKKSLNL